MDRLVCFDEMNVRGDETYGTILTRLADSYSEAFGTLASKAPRDPAKPFDHLRGFELIHLLETGHAIAAKTLFAKDGVQHWSALVGLYDVVFCRGLGPVICPINLNTPPCAASLIERQNILVCPIPFLKGILAENGDRTNDKYGYIEGNGYKWEYTGSPFRCKGEADRRECANIDECWSQRLQQIRPNRWFHIRHLRQESFEFMQKVSGVICFGRIQGGWIGYFISTVFTSIWRQQVAVRDSDLKHISLYTVTV